MANGWRALTNSESIDRLCRLRCRSSVEGRRDRDTGWAVKNPARWRSKGGAMRKSAPRVSALSSSPPPDLLGNWLGSKLMFDVGGHAGAVRHSQLCEARRRNDLPAPPYSHRARSRPPIGSRLGDAVPATSFFSSARRHGASERRSLWYSPSNKTVTSNVARAIANRDRAAARRSADHPRHAVSGLAQLLHFGLREAIQRG